jgi:hypothetical protein
MASHLSVSQDGAIYDVDRPSWDPPWIPHLANPSQTIPLSEDNLIDVVILGDGYEQRSGFEADLDDWLADLRLVEVYDRFRGAFRIRAVFTRSDHAASPDRESYYRVKINSAGAVSNSGEWWNGSSARNREFRRRLFCVLDLLPLNRKRYPSTLDVGSRNTTVIHNTLARMYSNLVVCLLVRTAAGQASGRTRDVNGPGGARLNVAFGALSIHEFGHAFAYLEDEYIARRRSKAKRKDPAKPSLYTLSNLSFRNRLDGALWVHLSPWGSLPRQGAEPDPSPIVGWLWRGGEQDLKVWHSEYQCLMNGGSNHENYAYTSDEASDPTAAPGGGFTGADLRSRDRYCLWCQEIVVARILEKTGQLAAADDPPNVNARGRAWYESWVSTWRPRYWSFFNVGAQIVDREAFYAHAPNFPLLDSHGLELWGSDLYRPFAAGPAGVSSAPDASDGEWLLLNS